MQVFLARPANCPVDINGKAVASIDPRDRHIDLFVSLNGVTFGEVCLPTLLGDKGYTIISSHDKHGAFVIADHDPAVNLNSQVVSNMCAVSFLQDLALLQVTLFTGDSYIGSNWGIKPSVIERFTLTNNDCWG